MGLLFAGRLTAQTFKTVYNLTGIDGAYPLAGLALLGNTLYGTTVYGGNSDRGTVFKINIDGTGLMVLHHFTAASASPPYGNSDGAYPYAGLVLSGNTLFGTAFRGGSSGNGTVFGINTDGTGFTNLHSFEALSNSANSEGCKPLAGLILFNNTLYGTAYEGGDSGNGTVYRVNTDGTGFTNLHSFTSLSDSTNDDGAVPLAGLALSGNTLYGTTSGGGHSGNGTVFNVKTDGTGFEVLHDYSPRLTSPSGYLTNSDGADPRAGLILSDSRLFGTTYQGGSWGWGTIFVLNTNGTDFKNLHSFNFDDGAFPRAALVLSGDKLFGTTFYGVTSDNNGQVFEVKTDGTGFTNLYVFTGLDGTYLTNSDGASPAANLILLNNTLYGTASQGGSLGKGTVFSISFAPQLTIIPSGASVILTWVTNVAGFDYTGAVLQSAPAVDSPFTNILGATSPYTNPITGSQKYFRLISN